MRTPIPAGARPGTTWTNWVGNQTCSPHAMASPHDEDEVAALVRGAAELDLPVRVAATGHSFTTVCCTDGLQLDLRAMRGVVSTDAARRRAVGLPGTTVGEFGPPLWEAGLALANQGDIDAQQIAGAVSTATHGSGLHLGNFSSTLRRVRLVDGRGEVVEIGEDDPDRLRAAQVAVGMLGVLTELELAVVPAYRIRERIEHRPFDEVMAEWDELVAGHRHFSYFWLPSEASAVLYGLETPPGLRMTDRCFVKLYDEAAPDEPDDATPLRRVDRAYRIYHSDFDPNFHELEYFLPLEHARDAIGAMRELMLRSQPDAVFPMEVRTTAADDAYLSPCQGRATVVISVSGVPGTDHGPYLRAVDALLGEFDARVHWGKLHFLTPEQLHARYPHAGDFIRVRRELDPDGRFLNDDLRALFA